MGERTSETSGGTRLHLTDDVPPPRQPATCSGLDLIAPRSQLTTCLYGGTFRPTLTRRRSTTGERGTNAQAFIAGIASDCDFCSRRRCWLGASAASAGEVTGNCNHAGSAQAEDNCKGEDGRVSNGNSWCSFSGQNDEPDNPITDENPGGNTQNWGQDVSKNHVGSVDPSEMKGGDGTPGTECNPNKTNFGGPPPRK
jgi:hypothetical protein